MSNVHRENNAAGRPDWIALGGVVVTVALHLLLQSTKPNPAFIGGACIFWATLVAIRAGRDHDALWRWGFRRENLGATTLASVAILLVAALGLGIYGQVHGTLWFPLNTLPLLAIYPLWGLAQQFLALGVALQNMERVPALGNRPALLVVLTAALFAAIHGPDLQAVAATFLLELAVVPVFRRFRNVWPLGVLHGWVGVLFYAWVQGRDMWAENFG